MRHRSRATGWDGTAVVQGVASIPLPGLSLQTDVRTSDESEACFRTRSYVAGNENRLAAAAIESFLGGSPTTYSPLVLTGPSGVGKSHLAQGLLRQWRRFRPHALGVLSTWHDFNKAFAAAVCSDQLVKFRTNHRTVQLLVIEDFFSPRLESAVEREFLHTLDALQAAAAVAVVTSRLTLGEMSHLSPSLKSRLTGGLALSLVPPGRVSRQEILRQLAVARGLKLNEESCTILGNRLTGTVPQMATALLNLEPTIRSAPPHEQSEITRRFTRHSPAHQQTTTRQIVNITAKYFSLKSSDIKSSSRKRTVVLARGVAIFLTRKITDTSFQQIGKYLSGRDHSTVLYNYHKIERLLMTDTALRATVAQIERILSGR